MELLLDRKYKKEKYTIGNLYVDGVWFCNTLEDTDRGLRQDLPLSLNKAKKRAGVTAIPTGRYRVTLDIQSPKMLRNPAKYTKYAFCGYRIPRLINVPAYDGVLIHIGNKAEHSEGCLLVGMNTVKGQLTQSTETFYKLYSVLKGAKGNIYITIK